MVTLTLLSRAGGEQNSTTSRVLSRRHRTVQTSSALSKFQKFRYLVFRRDSAVGTVTGFGLDGRVFGDESTGRGENFLLSTSSRPVLMPAQTPIQRVPVALSPGGK
jgi:hypothetical protein